MPELHCANSTVGKQRSPITEAEQEITGLPVNGGVSIVSVRNIFKNIH
jgi:hypothetical protein